MPDEAMAQAREADREFAAGHDRGPLHGVPIALKDLIDVRGSRPTAASHVRSERPAERDATVVARLRESGAVLIGKNNLHEFAYGTTSEDSAFGPTRNPHDLTRSPGGSSGGSAACVAADMAFASLGTDTGGSIRIPAAACGVVGLKPAWGEVSTEGVVPLSPTLDHVGPLARTVTDAWLVYRALIGLHDMPPPGSVESPDSRFCGRTSAMYWTMRSGAIRRFFEPATRRRGSHRRGKHCSLGIHRADLPHYPAGRRRGVPRADTRERSRAVHGTGAAQARMGRYVLAEDYARALAGREVLRTEVNRALIGYDAVVLPALPIPAPTLGTEVVMLNNSDHPLRAVMLRLTQLFNLTGHAAISIPCGRTRAGLPCGLQLAGHTTESLLRVARTCEQHLAPGT